MAAQTTNSSASEQTIQLQAQLVTVKLNESNHLVWKQQVLAAIRGYGLESFIDGTNRIPEPYLPGASQDQRTPNPAYSLWIRQDQLLVSWLLSTLSEGVLITTVGKNTSNEIWECLEAGFAGQNQAKVMQYKLQLQTVNKGNSSMREYLGKIKSLCDLLASAGSQVSEAEHISHILLGLGSEYDAVMISITTRAVPCTLMEAYSILLSFENRIENSENIGNDNSAFSVNLTTHGTGFRRNSENQSGRGRGFQQGIGNRGRSGRNGNFRGRGGRFGFNNNKSRCQICHYNNHTADKCFYRCDLSFSPGNRGSNTTTNGQSSNNSLHGYPVVNMASIAGSEAGQDFNWYPDSGATNHVTYDMNNLNIATDYEGREKVHIGNGTGSIHRGCPPTRDPGERFIQLQLVQLQERLSSAFSQFSRKKADSTLSDCEFRNS